MKLKTLTIVALCVISFSINGCKKKEVMHGVTYRPDNFPEILVPPENAIDIIYASPETAKIVKGCYSISCFIYEDYPTKETIEQMTNDLKSKGCVKVGWEIEDFAIYTEKDPGSGKFFVNNEKTKEYQEGFSGNQTYCKTSWAVEDYQEPGYIRHVWSDEWITPNDELISNVLSYRYPKGKKEMTKLYMYRSIFTPSSRKYQYVLKYKKMHPEQFEKDKTFEKQSH